MLQSERIPATIFDEMAGMKESSNTSKTINEGNGINPDKKYIINKSRLKKIFDAFQKNTKEKIIEALIKVKNRIYKHKSISFSIDNEEKESEKKKLPRKSFFEKLIEIIKKLWNICSNISLIIDYINFVKIGYEYNWNFAKIGEYYVNEMKKTIQDVKDFISDPKAFITKKFKEFKITIRTLYDNVLSFITGKSKSKNKKEKQDKNKKEENKKEAYKVKENNEGFSLFDNIKTWLMSGIDYLFTWLENFIIEWLERKAKEMAKEQAKELFKKETLMDLVPGGKFINKLIAKANGEEVEEEKKKPERKSDKILKEGIKNIATTNIKNKFTGKETNNREMLVNLAVDYGKERAKEYVIEKYEEGHEAINEYVNETKDKIKEFIPEIPSKRKKETDAILYSVEENEKNISNRSNNIILKKENIKKPPIKKPILFSNKDNKKQFINLLKERTGLIDKVRAGFEKRAEALG